MNKRLLYSVIVANGARHSPATIENFRRARERDRRQARHYRAMARIHPRCSKQREDYIHMAKTMHGLAGRWASMLPALP